MPLCTGLRYAPFVDRFGRYVLLRPLAAGGMGEVHLAEQTGLSGFAKRVALKRIRPELANNPSYVQMFLNEARTGSFLNHPNIVHVFDVGHADPELFLVMEYVDGIDLKRLQRRSALTGHPLTGVQVAAIAVEVLSALEVAHRGVHFTGGPIVHRDLSPENILLTRSGQVKVLDFGLAKWWPNAPAVSAMEGEMIFGKVRYMPPEQLKGNLIDGRADLFALGVVMYQVLAGRLPFGRGSAQEVLTRILTGPPDPLDGLRTDLPTGLAAVIERALEPNPKDRYARAEQMRSALVDVLQIGGEVLPLEGLRRLFRSSPDPEAVSHLPAPVLQQMPTQISLPVAERCGKCGGELKAFVIDDLILDQCAQCYGVWVDYGELERILGEGQVLGLTASSQEPSNYDRVVGSCPVHRVGLLPLPVPGQSRSLEVCPVCRGMWFDRDELKLLSHDHVLTWLQDELQKV